MRLLRNRGGLVTGIHRRWFVTSLHGHAVMMVVVVIMRRVVAVLVESGEDIAGPQRL